jgi:ketosteroid isomerase-like protein
MDNKQPDVRATITALYSDYQSRHLDKVLDGLPEDFCFEWASDPATARYSGICHGKSELVEQLNDIAANFEFNAYRPMHILVDGDRAAAELELELTSIGSGVTRRKFSARIAHFWEFTNGRPTKLVEYMDTALIASESGPRSNAQRDA